MYLKYKLRLPRDKANMETTIESVRFGATMSGANLWVLVTAILTASLGLNVNSTAVIIGAMLISPLMGPIMAIGMGMAIHDFSLVFRALKNFVLAIGLSLLTSTLYFFISPLKVPGSELLARTTPTIYDVLIAIVGGLAGIVAGSGKLRQSNVIPGVAIATALMPPLCTVGFGIANLNISYILGAFYLFFINSVFISLATYIIVRILRYPMVANVQTKRAIRIRHGIMALVLVTMLPSVYLTYTIVKQYVFDERAKSFVQKEFSGNRRIVLKSSSEFIDNEPVIKIVVLGSEVDSSEIENLTKRLGAYGLNKTRLEIKQGFGDVTRKGSLIGSINSAIENHTNAIGSIFSEIDSLKLKSQISHVPENTQLGLGREAKANFAGLTFFSISPLQFYQPDFDLVRNGWRAEVSFTKKQPPLLLDSLTNWLAARLGGDTLILSIKP